MKRGVWSVLFAAASLGLAACSDGIPLTGGAAVHATLTEWQIVTDRDTAPTGKITVTADNKGADVHDLVLLQTDLPADGLPITAQGDVDLAASGLLVVSEIKDLAPGASGELTIDDAGPGKYVFVTTVATSNGMTVGHPYAKGMFKAFTVAEIPGQE
jgi:microcompartment protein CcmK/EutM